MQLAPDPGLLLGDRPPGLQLLLAAAARGPVPQLTDVGAGQPPQRRENQADHRDLDPGYEGGDTGGRGPQRPGQGGPGGDAGPGRLPPRAVRGHRVQGHQQDDPDTTVGAPGDLRGHRGQRGGDHYGQHPDRVPPPKCQRQCLQQDQGDAAVLLVVVIVRPGRQVERGRQRQCQRGIARDGEPPSPPRARPRIRLSLQGPHAHQATPPRPAGHQAPREQVRQAPAARYQQVPPGTSAGPFGQAPGLGRVAAGPGCAAHLRFVHRCRLPLGDIGAVPAATVRPCGRHPARGRIPAPARRCTRPSGSAGRTSPAGPAGGGAWPAS